MGIWDTYFLRAINMLKKIGDIAFNGILSNAESKKTG